MANISTLLDIIKNAIYGRDMREAIHDSIKAVNDECSENSAKIGVVTSGVASIEEVLPNTVKYDNYETESWVLPLPVTDTSKTNRLYKIIAGNWNGSSQNPDAYWRFSYQCTINNAKIVKENGSYYLYCGLNDIPSQLWYRRYGNFNLADDLSVFNIKISFAVCQFSLKSTSGNIGSEVLKFNCTSKYGPDVDDLFGNYLADQFVDGVYTLGTVISYWGLESFHVGDSFVVTENGFVKLCADYALSSKVKSLETTVNNKKNKATIRTTVSNNTLVLNDNTETRLTNVDVATLTIKTPTLTYYSDYECYFSFKSGETPTTLTYSSTPIKWVGVDCDAAGDFVPVANKIYEVGVKLVGKDSDGNYVVIARVGVC